MDSIRYNVGKEETDGAIGRPETFEDAQIRGLVESSVKGDIEAYGELYGIYLDRIYRYIYYQIGNKAAAEDLTEEVFLKAWGAIGRYKWKGQPFTSWLYRIAHNHLVDYYRTRRQHEDLQLQENILADDTSIEEEVEGKATRQQILEAISSLPELQQQVVIMKFIDDLDNREIEQIIGKSQGAIRVLQTRALATLRQRLNGVD
ncbi:MAG: sigma-70 family RNA polymerase sigma factor [Dehalococcoidia bacterium]